MFISCTIAYGATATWDAGGGGSYGWTTPQNWVGDTVPTFNSSLDITFEDTANTTEFPWVGASRDVGKLTFTGPNFGGVVTTYTIQSSASDTLTIHGGIDNQADNWVTFNMNLALGADQTWEGSMVTKLNEDLDLNGHTLTIGSDANVLLKTWNPGASISGAGTININGSLYAENDNSGFSGTLNVNNSGQFTVSNSEGLGASPNDTTVASGGQLVLDYQGSNISLVDNVDIAGTGLDSDGTGAIRSLDGDNTMSGTITMTADSTIGVDADSLTISGAVTDGASSFGLTKVGDGELVLSSANTYDGTTTVSNGTLTVANATALGTSGNGTIVSNGATLGIQGNTTIASEPISITGTGESSTGAIRSKSGTNEIQSTITFAGNSTIAVDADTLTISSAFTDGASSYGLTKTGNGTLVLSAANTYDGTTTISNGTLTAANANALGTSGNGTTVSSGSTLALQGNINIVSEAISVGGTGESNTGAIRNISGSNEVGGAITMTANTTYTVDAGTLTLSGGISGAHDLDKEGSGTLVLENSSSYTGDTIVDDGTLQLGGSNIISDSSDLILDGGTFAANGNSETMGTLTLTSDSIIDMGAGASVLRFASITDASIGAHTLHVYNWSGNPGSGGGTDQLTFTTSAGLTKLDQIIFYTGAGTGQYTVNNQQRGFEIMPVPEPSTYAIGGLLTALGIGHYLRRRRKIRN